MHPNDQQQNKTTYSAIAERPRCRVG